MKFRTNLLFKNLNYARECKAIVSEKETVNENEERFMVEVAGLDNSAPFKFSLLSEAVYFQCPETAFWLRKHNNCFVPRGIYSYGKGGFYVPGEIVISTLEGLKKYQVTLRSWNEDLKKKLSKTLRAL